MEEVMIMEALMARLQDWRHLLADILEPALVLRSHSTVVDVCSLLRALKVGRSGCAVLVCMHGLRASLWTWSSGGDGEWQFGDLVMVELHGVRLGPLHWFGRLVSLVGEAKQALHLRELPVSAPCSGCSWSEWTAVWGDSIGG